MYFCSKIRDELNNPTTPNLKLWTGHRGKWECVTSEIAGRMYRVMSWKVLEPILKDKRLLNYFSFRKSSFTSEIHIFLKISPVLSVVFW